jgi:hypothetical protein
MGVYDRQIATALRLIAAKGQAVTWQSIDNGAPADASKPWLPADAVPVEHPVSILFLPDTRSGFEWLAYLQGTEVPQGRMIGLMGAVDFTPSIRDLVVRDGKPIRPLNITPLNPNGETILYTIGFAE